MTLKITWTIITLLFCNVVLSQTTGSSDIGQVRFMSRVAPIDAYKEQDFLTLFELREKNDLNMGIFLKNSLTNYLHLLAPELSANDLTERGNYQFSFYVDSTLVYTENLHPGAGTPESKNTRTAFRIPLISAAGEDSWGRFLWNRFLAHGGEEALSAGPHVLNIEIRPYVKVQTVRTGDLIAAGQLNILVIKPKADEAS